MKKLIIIFWHGLGDWILFTPVLRQLRQENPDVKIEMAYLERLPVPDLFAKCPYIDWFIPTPDPWNDFSSLEEGRHGVRAAVDDYIRVEAEYFGRKYPFKIVEVTMNPSLGIHKIHRAEKELGITVNDYKTEIFPNITEEIKEQAQKFLAGIREPRIFVHTKTGNSPKDVGRDVLKIFFDGVPSDTLIEYHSNDLGVSHLPIGNIPLEIEILRNCDWVICADSFIMHAACALGKKTTSIFISTPPEWVVPLHETELEVFKKL